MGEVRTTVERGDGGEGARYTGPHSRAQRKQRRLVMAGPQGGDRERVAVGAGGGQAGGTVCWCIGCVVPRSGDRSVARLHTHQYFADRAPNRRPPPIAMVLLSNDAFLGALSALFASSQRAGSVFINAKRREWPPAPHHHTTTRTPG